ncbi:MAG: 16S rRNA processing protein RimM [Hellea sp.]|nr:16S rRNA processing protein RimM [Hellea sp.]
MNENRTEQLICIAAIAGAFGVKGEVKIKPFTEDPKSCVKFGPFLDENGKVILTPIKTRPIKKGIAAFCKEVKTREQAEGMKSTKLYVPRSALPAPDDDQFYYSDLIGLTVELVDGKPGGRVKAVHDYGSGDLLEIETPGEKDWFHPFTKDAVPHVDIKGGKIVIDIVEPDEVVSGSEKE